MVEKRPNKEITYIPGVRQIKQREPPWGMHIVEFHTPDPTRKDDLGQPIGGEVHMTRRRKEDGVVVVTEE